MARFVGLVKKVGNTASINHQAAAASAARYALSPSHGPATQAPVVKGHKRVTDLGNGKGDYNRSSHNNVAKFQANINMRHPYKGPSAKSTGNDQVTAGKSSKISSLKTPSSSTSSRSSIKRAQQYKASKAYDPKSENVMKAGNPVNLSSMKAKYSK